MNAFIREVAVFTCVLVIAGFITDIIKGPVWHLILKRLMRWRICPTCRWPFRPEVYYDSGTRQYVCNACVKSASMLRVTVPTKK